MLRQQACQFVPTGGDGQESHVVGSAIKTNNALVLAQINGENGFGGGCGLRRNRLHAQAPRGVLGFGRVVTSKLPHPTACMDSFGEGDEKMVRLYRLNPGYGP